MEATPTYVLDGAVCYIYKSQITGTIPLYRGCSTSAQHIASVYPSELPTQACNGGFNNEGILGYVFSTQVPNTVPVYRMYIAVSGKCGGDHPLTTNPAEFSGYSNNGILFYAYSPIRSIPDPIPVQNIVADLFASFKSFLRI
jgi:hypothetical protein